MRNGIVRGVVSVACVAGFVGAAQVGNAQGTSASAGGDSALYVKAQQMVSNGDAAAGRALIDSLIGAAQTGTPRYAEALYWRAALAGSAADAERSYRQIVVDYPLSPRVDDALLRMGQLELTRGDREAALQHFQRLTLEHPDSPLRAKASYWAARAYLEKNDVKHACVANADALSHALASDVELRNQIDFQNQRCAGVALPTAVAQNAGAPSMSNASDASAAGQAAPSESGAVADAPEPAAEADAPVAEVPKAVSKVVKGKTKTAVKTAKPSKAPTAPAEKPVATESSSKKSGKFAVQVAAYYDRPQAEALATKLRGRGYPVHVDGDTAPFRVRIGHYATHAQAATALANLKAKKITGFVTQE